MGKIYHTPYTRNITKTVTSIQSVSSITTETITIMIYVTTYAQYMNIII